MKKKYLLFALALGLFTACDPCKDEGNFDITNISSEQLLEGAVFEQYAGVKNEDGSMTYTPAADGNYIKYNIPSVSSVQIFYTKSDGTESSLSYGASGGMFTFIPVRGSDSRQTVYFRYINQEGEEVVASKEFTLAVAADLATEVKLIASNSGRKIWKWNTAAPDGQVWGNLGGGGDNFKGDEFALNGTDKWWGVVSEEEFMGQLNHTNDGQAHGDESMDATMVFTEDGMITCYDATGKEIRSGKYEIRDYDPTYSRSSKYCGILHTDAGSILFPYEINSGGNMPTDFQIAYLSASRLVLIYPDKGDWKNNEGTFWQFYSTSDVEGCLTDNSEATWEWDDENGACWGNAGYGSFVYGGASSISTNIWWGVPSVDLEEQITKSGYGFNDVAGQTMTFTNEGAIKKSSGGNGGFSFDVSKTEDLGGYNEGKTLGRFYTTGDGVMFSQRINAADHSDLPSTINEFDIVYISDDNFVLAAPSFFKSANPDNASWQECTFWRFKKVKK